MDLNSGRLTIAFAQLLQHMRSANDLKYIVPNHLHVSLSSVSKVPSNAPYIQDTICQLMPHFERGKQHDSQEFLGGLLDRIDEDLKPRARLQPLMIQKPVDKPLPAGRSSNNGIVASCFQSECSSRLQCSICETVSRFIWMFSTSNSFCFRLPSRTNTSIFFSSPFPTSGRIYRRRFPFTPVWRNFSGRK